MFKKVFGIGLIILMLFSCFGSVSAGHITLKRTDKWLGGSWFNDWTNPPHFYQTKYKDGWYNEYNTAGNSGEFEARIFSDTWAIFAVVPFQQTLNIKNYDGRDIKLTMGWAQKYTVEYNGDKWQHNDENHIQVFTINAQYNEGWVKIPCN